MSAAILALVAGLLINEASDISPWVGRRFAQWAAKLRYGASERGHIRAEEWSALLDDRPGKLLKLITGLVFFLDSLPRAAWRLANRSRGEAPLAVVIPDIPRPTPPSQALTARQKGIVLTLMAAGTDGVTSRQMQELYGARIDGRDRQVLNELRLIHSRREGRELVHELTDLGWAWCTQEMAARREVVTSQGKLNGTYGSTSAALLALTAGLSRYMDRQQLTLVDIFGPDAEIGNEAGARTRRRKQWFKLPPVLKR